MESIAATGSDIVAAAANPSANVTAREKSQRVAQLVTMISASSKRDLYPFLASRLNWLPESMRVACSVETTNAHGRIFRTLICRLCDSRQRQAVG